MTGFGYRLFPRKTANLRLEALGGWSGDKHGA